MATVEERLLVEMRVADVRKLPAEGDQAPKYIVVLEGVDGTRCLPIWINRPTGELIALYLAKVNVKNRPLTYSFMASLLKAGNVRLREVRIINKVINETIYAVAVVEGSEKAETVDARPSDAISLALAAGATIFVEMALLEAIGEQNTADKSANSDLERGGCGSLHYLWAEGTEGAAEIAAQWMEV